MSHLMPLSNMNTSEEADRIAKLPSKVIVWSPPISGVVGAVTRYPKASIESAPLDQLNEASLAVKAEKLILGNRVEMRSRLMSILCGPHA